MRTLARSTINRFRRTLRDERSRLEELLAELEAEQERARVAETAAERSPDPNSAEGGSIVFEYEKEFSVARNARDLLAKVQNAERRLEKGKYGVCEVCGDPIPMARLEALPYVTTCVRCARRV